tara:strand:- start:4443 stop:5069 length:627 start_codon:yes stop_codon:yes gene_type:complete
LDCAEQNGFYCGDDPANWTQYAPNGCVPNGPDLFYLNDGWEDCVDGSDEAEAAPTVATDCAPPPPPPCDTVYVDVIQYETIFDTIINTEYVYEIIIDTLEVEVFVPEFVYVTDTVYVYEDILDTLFVDVIEYVDVIVYDTIIEIEYVEFIEYITEYVDCDTGLPCTSNIPELINKYNKNSVIYNINGQAIKEREGLYIEDGKVKLKIK